MKQKCFTPSKHSLVCAKLFTEDSFEQDLMVRSLLGHSFRPCCLALKRDVVLKICNSIVEHCKNNNKQANNALRKTGKLLSHFPSKIRFVFNGRSKTFPANNSLTQKHSNVQDNNDITKQTFTSIPSIKPHSHFGNVFLRPSAVYIILTFLLLFTAQKKKFCKSFLSNVLSRHFLTLKWLKKRSVNFGSFDL